MYSVSNPIHLQKLLSKTKLYFTKSSLIHFLYGKYFIILRRNSDELELDDDGDDDDEDDTPPKKTGRPFLPPRHTNFGQHTGKKP